MTLQRSVEPGNLVTIEGIYADEAGRLFEFASMYDAQGRSFNVRFMEDDVALVLFVVDKHLYPTLDTFVEQVAGRTSEKTAIVLLNERIVWIDPAALTIVAV